MDEHTKAFYTIVHRRGGSFLGSRKRPGSASNLDHSQTRTDLEALLPNKRVWSPLERYPKDAELYEVWTSQSKDGSTGRSGSHVELWAATEKSVDEHTKALVALGLVDGWHMKRLRMKGEGEPCKQGESAARSGCVPASGKPKPQVPVEPDEEPYSPDYDPDEDEGSFGPGDQQEERPGADEPEETSEEVVHPEPGKGKLDRKKVEAAIERAHTNAACDIRGGKGKCGDVSVSLWDELGRPADLVPYGVSLTKDTGTPGEDHVVLLNPKTGEVVDPTGYQYDKPTFTSKDDTGFLDWTPLSKDQMDWYRIENLRAQRSSGNIGLAEFREGERKIRAGE